MMDSNFEYNLNTNVNLVHFPTMYLLIVGQASEHATSDKIAFL